MGRGLRSAFSRAGCAPAVEQTGQGASWGLGGQRGPLEAEGRAGGVRWELRAASPWLVHTSECMRLQPLLLQGAIRVGAWDSDVGWIWTEIKQSRPGPARAESGLRAPCARRAAFRASGRGAGQGSEAQHPGLLDFCAWIRARCALWAVNGWGPGNARLRGLSIAHGKLATVVTGSQLDSPQSPRHPCTRPQGPGPRPQG